MLAALTLAAAPHLAEPTGHLSLAFAASPGASRREPRTARSLLSQRSFRLERVVTTSRKTICFLYHLGGSKPSLAETGPKAPTHRHHAASMTATERHLALPAHPTRSAAHQPQDSPATSEDQSRRSAHHQQDAVSPAMALPAEIFLRHLPAGPLPLACAIPEEPKARPELRLARA
ncbi:MAG: hypothetical protein [Cressdnaviricota sp.]|nr:MAG: hypothetical protein [Cressdnaviricota sp.]